MKRDNVNYLLVGSFVLAMAAVLLYALFRITGHGARGESYVTHFANVAGIKAGSVVTYEGYEIGNVERIEPANRDGRTLYRLTLNLRGERKIPADSRALIATPGLLAAPLIEIKEGQSRETLGVGGEIPGGGSANLMDSMATLAADLGRLTETSIRPLLAQVNQQVSPTMAELRTLLERANKTAGRVDRLFSDENVAHWNSLLRNVDATSANALRLSAELSAVRAEVEGLARDSRNVVNGSGREVQEVLRRLDTILHHLESTGRNLNEFSRSIRENPSALITSRPPADNAGANPGGAR